LTVDVGRLVMTKSAGTIVGDPFTREDKGRYCDGERENASEKKCVAASFATVDLRRQLQDTRSVATNSMGRQVPPRSTIRL
jgi:hypothetical protein